MDPQPVRGDDAVALQSALTGLHRELALPLVGDGRLAVLAQRAPTGASPAQLRAAAAELGLPDGHLSMHTLVRGRDGSWGRHAHERLRPALAEHRPTHFGAAEIAPGQARIIYGRRPAWLEPLPRRVDVGEPIVVRGRLPAVASGPVVELVAPDGAFRALPAGVGSEFEVQLPTPQPGTYRVTLRDEHARPWARLAIDAGRPSALPQDAPNVAPEARRTTYGHLVALRREHGQPPLATSHELERVAAGAAPLEGRLVLRGGVRAARLDALLQALERDPACRAALGHADVTHVGVHVARRGTGMELTLVTARLSEVDGAELSGARVLAAINRNRRARGGAPLTPDERLGEVARRAASAHLRGELDSEEAMVAAANAELERFSLTYRRVAAVVARVVDPHEASALEPALDPDATAVGIGVARLGAGTRAEGKPFLVVVALGWGRP